MKFLLPLVAVALLFAAAPAAAESADELIGIWRADVTFGPKLQGPLMVRRTKGGFAASIGG